MPDPAYEQTMTCPYCMEPMVFGNIAGGLRSTALLWQPSDALFGQFSANSVRLAVSSLGRPKVAAWRCERDRVIIFKY